jgi:hypothetical protein
MDVKTSYLGWGTIIASLNSEVGPWVAWSASALPTLVQIIAWAGILAASPILSHNTFIAMTVAAVLFDTIADGIALGFLRYIQAGDWGRMSATAFVVLGLYGLLSEFMFNFCLVSFITQIGRLKAPHFGWREGMTKMGGGMTSGLGGIMSGGMKWNEPPIVSSRPPESIFSRNPSPSQRHHPEHEERRVVV